MIWFTDIINIILVISKMQAEQQHHTDSEQALK